MYPELTNLLSHEQIQAFRRMYLLRLTTLAITMMALLVCVHGLLLAPSYLYARTQHTQQEKELASINASLESSQEKDIKARIKALGETVTYLNKAEVPTASGALQAIVAAPRTGIKLSSFTFTPPKATDGLSTMTLSGVSNSRESLRQYVQVLGELPYVKTVDLPISAYAEVKDIAFTITVTGSFKATP